MELSRKRLFLFDIDGTLAVGDDWLPGAPALLDRIDALGGRSLFITNNSTRSRAAYVERFRTVFGRETDETQFVTASYLTALALRERFPGRKVYAQGTCSFLEELRAFGVDASDDPACDPVCVVVGYDSELTYAKLCATARLLQETELPFFAANPDLRCPAPFGFIPDCGSICRMLADTTGREPVYFGKPEAGVVARCLAETGFSLDETLVVGDRLYTDIACGLAAGADTCLFLTGEAQKSDLPGTAFPPDYVLDGPADLLRILNSAPDDFQDL